MYVPHLVGSILTGAGRRSLEAVDRSREGDRGLCRATRVSGCFDCGNA